MLLLPLLVIASVAALAASAGHASSDLAIMPPPGVVSGRRFHRGRHHRHVPRLSSAQLLTEYARAGRRPPPHLISAALEEARRAGEEELVLAIVNTYIRPVVQASEAVAPPPWLREAPTAYGSYAPYGHDVYGRPIHPHSTHQDAYGRPLHHGASHPHPSPHPGMLLPAGPAHPPMQPHPVAHPMPYPASHPAMDHAHAAPGYAAQPGGPPVYGHPSAPAMMPHPGAAPMPPGSPPSAWHPSGPGAMGPPPGHPGAMPAPGAPVPPGMPSAGIGPSPMAPSAPPGHPAGPGAPGGHPSGAPGGHPGGHHHAPGAQVSGFAETPMIPLGPASSDDEILRMMAHLGAPLSSPTAAPGGFHPGAPLEGPPSSTGPGTLTVSGRSSPIDGVATSEWAKFCDRMSRELPTYTSAHHVGQFRQHRGRLLELGIDPDTVLTSPIHQQTAFDRDMSQAHQQAAATGLLSYVGHSVDVPTPDGPPQIAQITPSGVLAVVQAAGVDGALGWFSSAEDRRRFPGTTAVFSRANGVF